MADFWIRGMYLAEFQLRDILVKLAAQQNQTAYLLIQMRRIDQNNFGFPAVKVQDPAGF